MKKKMFLLISVIMMLTLVMGLTSCGSKTEEPEEQTAGTEATAEEGPAAVTSITDIDTEGMSDLPLQIESVTLYEDGSVRLVPLDDLKKTAEDNDELKDGAMYPFADAGKARAIYLVRFGNEGYRTVIALMEDGTLSAMSGAELIKDHIAVVMPNLTGRDTYVSVEQKELEDGAGVVGITEDGEEIELDFSLNF